MIVHSPDDFLMPSRKLTKIEKQNVGKEREVGIEQIILHV